MDIKELYELIKQKKELAERNKKVNLEKMEKETIHSKFLMEQRGYDICWGEIMAYDKIIDLIESSGELDE